MIKQQIKTNKKGGGGGEWDTPGTGAMNGVRSTPASMAPRCPRLLKATNEHADKQNTVRNIWHTTFHFFYITACVTLVGKWINETLWEYFARWSLYAPLDPNLVHKRADRKNRPWSVLSTLVWGRGYFYIRCFAAGGRYCNIWTFARYALSFHMAVCITRTFIKHGL